MSAFNYYELSKKLGMRRASASMHLVKIVLFLVVLVPILSVSAVLASIDLGTSDYSEWDLFGGLATPQAALSDDSTSTGVRANENNQRLSFFVDVPIQADAVIPSVTFMRPTRGCFVSIS